MDHESISSFTELQLLTRTWRARNFPSDQTPIERAVENTLGVAEESGELAHAVLKMKQGIRGDVDSLTAEAKDAIGDCIIYLCGVCDNLELSLHDCVAAAWHEIEGRDWVKYPLTGKPPKGDE